MICGQDHDGDDGEDHAQKACKRGDLCIEEQTREKGCGGFRAGFQNGHPARLHMAHGDDVGDRGDQGGADRLDEVFPWSLQGEISDG